MLLNNTNHVVLGTLLYSDIFDYPLTGKELHTYQIASWVFQGNEQDTKTKSDSIQKKNNFFYIKGRDASINQRIARRKISMEKIAYAKKIAAKLFHIPTIQLIGLSGSVAMKNASEYDDIDFFIITQSHTIWLTRFIVIVFLHVLGARRKRFTRQTKNKICSNMFIDEQQLALPINLRNLYTAHEVIQMKPLIKKGTIYKQFLSENRWVRDFLPHAIVQDVQYIKKIRKNNTHILFSLGEFFAKKLQVWYMAKYKTREITTDTLLAFHPIDRARNVLDEFKRRCKKYEI